MLNLNSFKKSLPPPSELKVKVPSWMKSQFIESTNRRFSNQPGLKERRTTVDYSKTNPMNNMVAELKARRKVTYEGLLEITALINEASNRDSKEDFVAQKLLDFMNINYQDIVGFKEIVLFLSNMIFCNNGTPDVSFNNGSQTAKLIKTIKGRKASERQSVDKSSNVDDKRLYLESLFKDETSSKFNQRFTSKMKEVTRGLVQSGTEKNKNNKKTEKQDENELPFIDSKLMNQMKIKDGLDNVPEAAQIEAARNSYFGRNSLAGNNESQKSKDEKCDQELKLRCSYKQLYEELLSNFKSLQTKTNLLKKSHNLIKQELRGVQSDKNQTNKANLLKIQELSEDLKLIPAMRKEKFELLSRAVQSEFELIKYRKLEKQMSSEIDAILKQNLLVTSASDHLKKKIAHLIDNNEQKNILVQSFENKLRINNVWKEELGERLCSIKQKMTAFEQLTGRLLNGALSMFPDDPSPGTSINKLQKGSAVLDSGLNKVSSLRLMNDKKAFNLTSKEGPKRSNFQTRNEASKTEIKDSDAISILRQSSVGFGQQTVILKKGSNTNLPKAGFEEEISGHSLGLAMADQPIAPNKVKYHFEELRKESKIIAKLCEDLIAFSCVKLAKTEAH